MRVDLALFDGDELPDHREIAVGPSVVVDAFKRFQTTHQLGPESAELVLGNFAGHLGLTKETLKMPIHESDDWASIDIGTHMLASRCRVDA